MSVQMHMVERKREKTFQVRMLEAEQAMLDQLADHEGVTASEWIRNIIRREHLVTFGAKPKSKRK